MIGMANTSHNSKKSSLRPLYSTDSCGKSELTVTLPIGNLQVGFALAVFSHALRALVKHFELSLRSVYIDTTKCAIRNNSIEVNIQVTTYTL